MYEYNSVADYISTSNEPYASSVERGDRRVTVLKTRNTYTRGISSDADIKEHFDAIYNENPSDIAKFFYNYDISNFISREIPMTEAKQEQALYTMDHIDKWLDELLTYEEINVNGRIIKIDHEYSRDELFIHYREYSKDIYTPKSVLFKKLYNIFPELRKQRKTIDLDKKRTYKIKFENIIELRKSFAKYYHDGNMTYDDYNSEEDNE
jgi:hypothetical protein